MKSNGKPIDTTTTPEIANIEDDRVWHVHQEFIAAAKSLSGVSYFEFTDTGVGFRNIWMDLIRDIRKGSLTAVVIIVADDTNAEWFQRCAHAANAVCFPNIHWRHTNHPDSPRKLIGQAIIYIGENCESFCKEFSQFGATFRSESTLRHF